MVNRIIFFLILIFLLDACRKSDFIAEGNQEVYRDNGTGTGTVTWTKDKEYLIEGFMYVNDGQVLTIEPGTVVRFRQGQAENASALIVSRGGKIIANGTKTEPIIFTSEGDDLAGSVGKDDS
jgi:predicted enzyme related to lactoylglutathione lyase